MPETTLRPGVASANPEFAAPPALRQQLAAIRERAKVLHERGQLAEALQAHAEALALAPGAVGIWLSAARLAHAMNRQDISLPHFEQALKLDPTCYAAVESARRICLGVGLAERAARYSAMAYELQPAAETLISSSLIVPCIARSQAEITETRIRYEQGLEEVLASPLRLARPEGALGISAFFLAYHGCNDRDLQVKTARMFQHLIPSLAMTAQHCLTGAPRTGRIRIGFISRFFSSHSIFSTSRGLIEKLSRERFEVFALRITPSREDDATRQIRAAADHAVDLDPDIYRAREQLAALELDILFYQDIGMEQTSYFLAFARLAPVQCVSFGHPNTTGIPAMDYFVSSDLFELADAQSHYSEKLHLLHDVPTLAYYYKPPAPPVSGARESFGFPVHTHVYVCPQTLYKLHPDFDELLRGILCRDSNARIVLIAGQFDEFTSQLRERFVRSMPALSQRICFLPRLPFDRFMQLLAAADVVLDTPHFNGMNSSLQCFAVGTPVVTLPTTLQRGRHTQAMYRRMNMTDCIADDAKAYIEIAVRIGTDRAYAQSLRERILAANHVLFEDWRVVDEFEKFFVAALQEKLADK